MRHLPQESLNVMKVVVPVPMRLSFLVHLAYPSLSRMMYLFTSYYVSTSFHSRPTSDRLAFRVSLPTVSIPLTLYMVGGMAIS